jgi:hypothetical protein
LIEDYRRFNSAADHIRAAISNWVPETSRRETPPIRIVDRKAEAGDHGLA